MPKPTTAALAEACDTSLTWFCAHAKSLKETFASNYCQNTLGLEVYFPRLLLHRTIRRKRRLVEVPLFPGYFFCRFNRFISYRAVRYAPEVLNVVRRGQAPAPVPDQLIAELKAWAGDAFDILTLEPQLKLGDSVSIVEGPMRGLTAKILRISDDQERVAVLLTTLECRPQLTISRSQLRRDESWRPSGSRS